MSSNNSLKLYIEVLYRFNFIYCFYIHAPPQSGSAVYEGFFSKHAKYGQCINMVAEILSQTDSVAVKRLIGYNGDTAISVV